MKNAVLGKDSIQNWGGDEEFTRQKIKELTITRPALQKMLKGLLQVERESYHQQ